MQVNVFANRRMLVVGEDLCGVGDLASGHVLAWVAATASAKNKDLIQGLGADQFVDYSSERFEDVVEPCDLVIDMLGDSTLTRSFDVVKPCGTIVSIKGDAPEGLATERNVEFHSFFMQPSGEQLTEIATLISNGMVRPILDSTFPLDDVAAAYAHARSGRTTGRVAVTLR